MTLPYTPQRYTPEKKDLPRSSKYAIMENAEKKKRFNLEVFMKFLLKHWLQAGVSALCVSAMIVPGFTVHATEIDSMEQQSSQLKNELSGINQDLLELGSQIADLEDQIAETNNQIEATQAQIDIAKNSEQQQFEEMKLRIKYVYENDSASMLSMIFSVDNMADFLNRVEFVQNVSDYDREQLEELCTLRETIEEEEAKLQDEKDSQEKMEKELADQKEELNAKAEATSTDLAALSDKIASLRAEEAAKQAEAQKAQAQAQETSGNNNAGTGGSQGGGSGSSSSGSSGGGNYIIPDSGGVLTPEKGVVYFNGHRETYYSQKVLPGHGLNIPGRHVASDGTIRDKDGYICVASSDHPKGTVVLTSLGPGKVYDTGCPSGTIDIYTDW
jgi:peptidoglycan hydrolase CwlO-like protein